MQIERIDHIVFTVRDIEATCEFYERVLGMEAVSFGEGRMALQFGHQKINLHQAGKEFEPKAALPTPGAIDLCFITHDPIERVIDHLRSCGVDIEAGPGERAGARGPMTSVYFRDLDGNLVEVSRYPDE
jgi:catechol 2,3-dioxygenase-like lactoylglutathione lyase family enzyme